MSARRWFERRTVPRRTRDDDPLAVFVRGATVGAFVGAVIAGSAIWRRTRRRPGGAPVGAGPRAARVAPPARGENPDQP